MGSSEIKKQISFPGLKSAFLVQHIVSATYKYHPDYSFKINNTELKTCKKAQDIIKFRYKTVEILEFLLFFYLARHKNSANPGNVQFFHVVNLNISLNSISIKIVL